MLAKVKKTIEKFAMLTPGDRVLAAVSGGPDSVALLKILTLFAEEYNLSVVAAHFNHGLRGREGDDDEDFVRRLSLDLGVEFVCKRVDIPALRGKGKSLEELCREERYSFLKQAAQDSGATKIALGHHIKDQAETVLLNLFRGSGAEGLRGMLPVRDGILIRPLLQVAREEILAFLEGQGLPFVNDSSNASNCYRRNRIRNNLLPLLKEGFNPQVEENLAHTADIMRLDDEYMGMVVGELMGKWGVSQGDGEKEIYIPALMNLHEALRHRVIKVLLMAASKSAKGIGYRHIKAALALAQGSRVSGSLDLPGGITLRREYELLRFCKKSQTEELAARRRAGVREEGPSFYYRVDVPGRVNVEEAGITIDFQLMDRPDLPLAQPEGSIAYMDYENMRPPLALRSVRPGDRMEPLGMKGTKKLKSLFIDEKVPRLKRHLIPILVDRETVLWIAAMRMSERVGVTKKTRRVLKVEII